jgi:hypothetical protein
MQPTQKLTKENVLSTVSMYVCMYIYIYLEVSNRNGGLHIYIYT